MVRQAQWGRGVGPRQGAVHGAGTVGPRCGAEAGCGAWGRHSGAAVWGRGMVRRWGRHSGAEVWGEAGCGGGAVTVGLQCVAVGPKARRSGPLWEKVPGRGPAQLPERSDGIPASSGPELPESDVTLVG